MKTHIEDDNTGQSGWFAVNDIDRRAKLAYKKHSEFFDSDAHTDRCASAKALVKLHAKFYSDLYVTERDERDGPCTEIKLNRVEFRPGMRVKLDDILESAGFKKSEFGYRVSSESYFVKVK
jgi:hypothetical protein